MTLKEMAKNDWLGWGGAESPREGQAPMIGELVKREKGGPIEDIVTVIVDKSGINLIHISENINEDYKAIHIDCNFDFGVTAMRAMYCNDRFESLENLESDFGCKFEVPFK